MTPLTGESQQIFMPAVLAFHAGKAVVQIAAIEITANHLLNIGTPGSVLSGEIFVIGVEECFKIVFNTSVIIG